MNEVVRFALSDKAATASLGINITNEDFYSKVEAGAIGLSLLGSTEASGCCTDYSGNIYIADSEAHAIFKISEGGKISLLAGEPGTSGSMGTKQNVPALEARFNTPMGIACDRSNNIYVADSGNNQIKVINSGRVSVVAGSGASGLVDTSPTLTNGPLDAQFNAPLDLDVDAKGVVYVADTGNHAVRKIEGGRVFTIAGNGDEGDLENVQSLGKNDSYFDSPNGICVDNDGNLFVSDTGNSKIKKITPRGWVYLHSGSGEQGSSLGELKPGSNKINKDGESNPYTCEYAGLKMSDMDRSGNMYVIDKNEDSDALILVDKDGVPNIICRFDDSDGKNTAKAVCVSPGQKLFVVFSG